MRAGKVRFERFDGFFERAAERADGRRGPAFHLGGLGRIVEQRLQSSRHFIRAAHEPKPLVALQNGVGFGEIEGVRSAQNPGAELDRLDRVLPAVMDERSADKRQRRKRVEKAKLADRIRKINLGVFADRLASGAPRDGKPPLAKKRRYGFAAIRVSRRHDGQERRHRAVQHLVHPRDHLVLARMCARRQEYGPVCKAAPQLLHRGRVDWRRRGIVFQIADDVGFADAERA